MLKECSSGKTAFAMSQRAQTPPGECPSAFLLHSSECLDAFLFCMFTNKYQLDLEKFVFFKYADDMALVALLRRGRGRGAQLERKHTEHVPSLQKCCRASERSRQHRHLSFMKRSLCSPSKLRDGLSGE